MERDFGIEIERLEHDIEEIKRTLRTMGAQEDREKSAGFVSAVQRMRDSHPDPAIKMIMSRLEASATEMGETGAVTYMGVFTVSGKSVSWLESGRGTDALMKLGTSEKAATLIDAVSSIEKINLLITLLREPMTVNELLTACGYSSTGQIYHHIKPLIAAGIIIEDKSLGKGVYAIQEDKVKGIIMLLTGIMDLMR